jgi:hypothetical protein
MKNQDTQGTKEQEPQRQPYEPPKADFVPLKLEERLMQCGKTIKFVGGCVAAFGS